MAVSSWQYLRIPAVVAILATMAFDCGFALLPSPPDTDGAVGSNYVMTVVNSSVLIQDRDGNTVESYSHNFFWTNGIDGVELTPFIGQASDPRVLYDPYENRWIVTASGDILLPDASLLVAVSASSSPTGEWFRYEIPAGTNATSWIDNPNLGFNTHWIAVSCNLTSRTNLFDKIGRTYLFDKQSLYTNGPGVCTSFDLSESEVDMVPATTYDPQEDALYLVHIPPSGAQSRISSVTGNIGAEQFNLNITTAEISEAWTTIPPSLSDFAPQAGTTREISSQGRLFTSCLYRNGSLWYTHQIYKPSLFPSRSAVQWWQTETNGTVTQHGQIDDPTGEFYYSTPSLAVNMFNDVVVGFSRFSSNTFASACYAYRAGTDPTNQLQATHVLKPGDGPFDRPNGAGLNLWGDHSSSSIDPVDDTALWTVQEYAAGPSNLWGTWWGQIDRTPELDLHVSMTTSATNLTQGDNVTYTIVVSNAGPVTATDTRVIDPLPSIMTFSSVTSSVGSCSFSNQSVHCNLGNLPIGASESVTVEVIASLPGPAINSAVGYSDNVDTNLLDNTASTTSCVSFAVLPTVWINEVHYDDAGILFDTDEGVEIAGAAGTDLSALQLICYDGSTGESYDSLTLSGTIDDEGNGFGARWFPMPFMQNATSALLNPDADGVVLAATCGQVLEFISYEGTLTASNGPAAGLQSMDIGVEESDSTAVGHSLQLAGMGLERSNFAWQSPSPASPGFLNDMQFFEPPEYADLVVMGGVNPAMVTNGESVVYSMIVSNSGPDTAEFTTLEVQLPTGVVFDGAGTDQGTCTVTGGMVRCEVGTLSVSGAASVSITGTTVEVAQQTAVAESSAKQNDTNAPNSILSMDLCVALSFLPNVWINEFHYDDTNLFDMNEGVEIAGVAGTDLSGFRLLLYDGSSGNVYNSVDLDGEIDDEGPGFGAVWFPISPMQNGQLIQGIGKGDGVALALPCSGILQFISYESVIMANDGQAAGISSTDVGLFELGATTASDASLQLVGTGEIGPDFSWTGPAPHSPGTLNVNQVLVPANDPDLDGIYSYWESLHFGGPTNAIPLEDPDGDNFSNLEEFIADTDPTNAMSFFFISSVAHSNDTIIMFHSSTGRLYGMEFSTNPVSPSWSVVVTDIPGNGGLLSLMDTNMSPPSCYRANVRLP